MAQTTVGCVFMKMEEEVSNWQVLIKGGTLSFLNPHPQTNFCCFMGLIVRVLHIRGWMSSQHESLREKVLCHIHELECFQ